MQDPIADFRRWYSTRPLITKTYLTCSTLLAVVLSLNYLTVYNIFYTYSATILTGEFWRPLTALLYQGDIGVSFIFEAYFSYWALIVTERDLFGLAKFADYLILLGYLFWGMVVFASFVDVYWISHGFFFALIYIWCRYKPFQNIVFLFGIDMKSGWFPWVYLGLTVLMGHNFIELVAGLALGHLYIVVRTTLKDKIGIDLFKAPAIMRRVVKLYTDWAARDNPFEPVPEQEDE